MSSCLQVTLPVGKESEAYAGILGYLGTLDNPEDVCRNILTFYDTVNSGSANDTTAESRTSPLANPYNVSSQVQVGYFMVFLFFIVNCIFYFILRVF